MKIRYLLLAFILLMQYAVKAQLEPPVQDNYIVTQSFKFESKNLPGFIDDDTVLQTTQYFDGLGRLVQTVTRNTDISKDVIIQTGYDAAGRQNKTYLPYTSSHQTDYHNDWETDIDDFYDDSNNDVVNEANYYYNEVIFEDSPLGRPAKAFGAGTAWRTADKFVESQYDVSTSDDDIPQFRVDANYAVTYLGDFGAGSLIVTKSIDENGGVVEEFKELHGRTLTKKVLLEGTDYAITHYLYDDYGNLAYVVQPEGVIEVGAPSNWETKLNDAVFQKNWCFRYQYDWKNRMVEKQVPGSEPVYMIYDNRDRLILTQSGNERIAEVITADRNVDYYEGKSYDVQSGRVTLKAGFEFSASATNNFVATTQSEVPEKWLFTKYDNANRPVLTGIYYSTETRTQLEIDAEAITDFDVEYIGTGSVFGYESTGFPTVLEDDVLTVTYYDNYSFDTNIDFPAPMGALASPKGQVTGSLNRVLGESALLTTVSFYDDRMRAIKGYTQNHLNGVDIVTTNYRNNVADVVTQTVTEHNSNNYSGTLKTTETFSYDKMDRLVSATHQIGTGALVELSALEYNQIGETKQKKIHAANGSSTYLQSIDYSYNIRGWLNSINNGDAISGDEFGLQLDYTAEGWYNGNIGKMSWKTVGQPLQSFEYDYDKSSRLITADYVSGNTPMNGHFDVGVDYYANGNIKTLTRNMNGMSVDNLAYNYSDGNQLAGVIDNGSVIEISDPDPRITKEEDLGFFDDGDNLDYSYDDNGNMVTDDNKGIVRINYNHFNLPEKVIIDIPNQDEHDYVKYIYDASGIKLQKESKTGSNIEITDYITGKHYINGTLAFLQHSEGRVVHDNGGFQYEYNLTDHLGNVRVSLNSAGQVIQKDDYYPFGLTFNSTASGDENLYKFNGKESQNETHWIDYGARMYMADIGRFTSIDPWVNKYRNQGAYNYAFNNPIRFTDYMGMGPEDEVKTDPVYTNETISTYSAGENSVTITTTNTQTVERTETDGAISRNITETVKTTNTYKVSTFVGEDGSIQLNESSTETIESSRTTVTTLDTNELGPMQLGEASTESNIYGNDGTRNVSLSDQESTVKDYGQAVRSLMMTNLDARGIAHTFTDRQANSIGALFTAIGVKIHPAVGFGAGFGLWIGTEKRIQNSETNFAGFTQQIRFNYNQFSKGEDGSIKQLKTVRVRLGGYE